MIICVIITIMMSAACSKKEDKNNNPTGPSGRDTTIVQIHGALSVSGNRIVNQHGKVVSFAGNSFFWSNWAGGYYNADCVNWLVEDWGTTIIRAAMGIDPGDAYLQNPEREKYKVTTLVNAAIEAGIYVIIDWHSHQAEDHQSEAVQFFSEMAVTYGDYPNVIYEIYNEPEQSTWEEVKSYARAVIAAIRLSDPDNLIIVGSPDWSQKVDLAAQDPITGYDNIAYTLHFYSVNHKQWLRDRASDALDKGIALMVTEWGAVGISEIDPESEAWMAWCRDNHITHLHWAINDKDEPWSHLKPGVGGYRGGWTEDQLSKTGKLNKKFIQNWPTYE